jgi:hypothetical protein
MASGFGPEMSWRPLLIAGLFEIDCGGWVSEPLFSSVDWIAPSPSVPVDDRTASNRLRSSTGSTTGVVSTIFCSRRNKSLSLRASEQDAYQLVSFDRPVRSLI